MGAVSRSRGCTAVRDPVAKRDELLVKALKLIRSQEKLQWSLNVRQTLTSSKIYETWRTGDRF